MCRIASAAFDCLVKPYALQSHMMKEVAPAIAAHTSHVSLTSVAFHHRSALECCPLQNHTIKMAPTNAISHLQRQLRWRGGCCRRAPTSHMCRIISVGLSIVGRSSAGVLAVAESPGGDRRRGGQCERCGGDGRAVEACGGACEQQAPPRGVHRQQGHMPHAHTGSAGIPSGGLPPGDISMSP